MIKVYSWSKPKIPLKNSDIIVFKAATDTFECMSRYQLETEMSISIKLIILKKSWFRVDFD